MKWFKSKKQKRIEELESELAKVKEMAYSSMYRVLDKLDDTNKKIDNLKFTTPSYRTETHRVETLCASFSLDYDVSMLEEDIKERLVEGIIKEVSNHMITYNHYDPRTMKTEFMGYIKVLACPDRTFYDQKLIPF